MSAAVLYPGVAGIRLRQLPQLGRPYVGALRWQPSVGAAALAAMLLAWQFDDLGEPGSGILVLRGVAALLALGAVFLLDDAAAGVLASSPTSLAWRRSSRLVAGALLVGVPWAGALVVASGQTAVLPLRALSLEFAALLVVALGVAAALARWADADEPGLLAAPVVVGVILGLLRLPERWALVVGPGPAWDPAHQRWALLLGAAAIIALHCTRDPASAHPGRPGGGTRR